MAYTGIDNKQGVNSLEEVSESILIQVVLTLLKAIIIWSIGITRVDLMPDTPLL